MILGLFRRFSRPLRSLRGTWIVGSFLLTVLTKGLREIVAFDLDGRGRVTGAGCLGGEIEEVEGFKGEDVVMEISLARMSKEVLVSRKRISVLDKSLLPMRLKLL